MPLHPLKAISTKIHTMPIPQTLQMHGTDLQKRYRQKLCKTPSHLQPTKLAQSLNGDRRQCPASHSQKVLHRLLNLPIPTKLHQKENQKPPTEVRVLPTMLQVAQISHLLSSLESFALQLTYPHRNNLKQSVLVPSSQILRMQDRKVTKRRVIQPPTHLALQQHQILYPRANRQS